MAIFNQAVGSEGLFNPSLIVHPTSVGHTVKVYQKQFYAIEAFLSPFSALFYYTRISVSQKVPPYSF